jgi:thiol-disulfide isomerase/thioredoxin
MNSHHIIFLFGLFVSNVLFSQNISGVLPQLANQEIRLSGFNGLKDETIGTSFVDSLGNFQMTYSKKYFGVGYLISKDNKPFIVILNGEDIVLKGNALIDIESIKILKGKENQAFDRYAKEHPKREQALSAWNYLLKMYSNDSLFSVHKNVKNSITNEKNRLQSEDEKFIASLPQESYIRWFLPIRRLVSDAPLIAQYRPEALASSIRSFRNIDYTDHRLYRSGLFKESIENHFLLIENSGKPLDSVFKEMNISIDFIIAKLVSDPKKLNEVSDYLFDFLERRSLFTSAEYLALKLLNDKGCTLESNLSNQLETYRAMKKGNIAPDMVFDKSLFAKPEQSISKLSDIKSSYTLVVFGASWCPKCTEELPEIAKKYNSWKEKGLEVVFIGLEDSPSAFQDFAKAFPYRSYSDLKKWKSPIVLDYYVFGTPTMFLLDKNRKILLRPHSVKQLEAWLQYQP